MSPKKLFAQHPEWAVAIDDCRTTAGGAYELRKMVAGVSITASSKVSRTDAYHRYAERVDAYVRGIERERSRTAAEWIEEVFLARLRADVAAGMRSPETLRTYEHLFRNHIKRQLGRKRLEDIARHDVDAIMRGALVGNKPATANMVRQLLSVVLSQAEYLGLIDANPVRRTRPLPAAPPEVAPLTPEELARFLAAASRHRLYLAILLTLATGLRSGEVRGLRWRDIDFEKGRIVLSEQVQRVAVQGKKVYQRRALKGKRTRLIPLPSNVIEHLIQARDHRTSELCFPAAHGGYIGTDSINALVQTLMRRCEPPVPARKFHALRHTCASLLAARGVTAHEIAALLGHTDATITTRIYTHLFPDDRGRVAGEMEGILGTILGAAPTPPPDDPSAQGAGQSL